MPAGLFMPLQLAANLLALGAAAGFAAVVLLRVGRVEPAASGRRAGRHDALLVAGSVGLVLGHGLDGALVPGRGALVGWLLAGGLALVALGAAPHRLPAPAADRDLEPSSDEPEASPPDRGTAHAALLPAVPALVVVPPLSAAVVGAVAGAAGALRVAAGGRDRALVAVALALWGIARGLQPFNPLLAALCTIGGAAALGAWMWQVSASQLRAKIIVAFLTTILALAAGLALVLSARGANDLVEEELVVLQTSASALASDITAVLPDRAATETLLLRDNPRRVVDRLVASDDPDAAEGLREVLLQLTDQDLLMVLDLGTGEVALSAHRDGVPDDLAEQIAMTAPAGALVEGADAVQGVARVGDALVSVGGGPVGGEADPLGEIEGDARDARYAVLGARLIGAAWVAEEADRLPYGVGLEVAGEPGPMGGVDDGVELGRLLRALGTQGPDRGTVTIAGESRFVAAEPVTDPLTDTQIGRVVTVRSGGALADLQRAQARQLFILALLGALIAAVIAGTVAGRLLAPVQRLTAAAAAVGRGRLDTTAAIDSPDEMGTLGRTFDEMTRSLSTQSRQLRAALDEQARLRARLEALTESMSDGLVATDEDGDVITFNPAAARLTGQAAADVEGRPLDEALRLADGAPATEILGDVRSDEVRAARVLVAGADRKGVPTDVTAAPVRDADERIVGRVLVLRDVTREAEIERMKTEFLSNVSHELRTPLTPIRGFADILYRRDLSPEDARRHAGQILEATARLERVVARIVDFAALDSGRMRPRPEDVDVSELVDEVLAGWRQRAPDRQFRRRVARELPPLRTDRTMLTRCLDELVDNAVKFSEPDQPVVVAAAHDGGAGVRLSVRDRGVGFEPDRATVVFSEFYQVDASETRHFDGLGLGLSLVRRIVDELGGDATVESSPGQGATFHLRLPAGEPAAD